MNRIVTTLALLVAFTFGGLLNGTSAQASETKTVKVQACVKCTVKKKTAKPSKIAAVAAHSAKKAVSCCASGKCCPECPTCCENNTCNTVNCPKGCCNTSACQPGAPCCK